MRGTWLRKAGSTTPSMAIVFVHGILSDNEKCWLHENGAYWPDLLASHEPLNKVGIYDFTYQTSIFSGSYSLGDVVSALKEKPRAGRSDCGEQDHLRRSQYGWHRRQTLRRPTAR